MILIGVGLLIKFGPLVEAFDIIVSLIAKKTGRNVGFMSDQLFSHSWCRFLNSWEYAPYSCIAILLADAIHTGEQRLTAFAICQDLKPSGQGHSGNVVRGVTPEGQAPFSPAQASPG